MKKEAMELTNNRKDVVGLTEIEEIIEELFDFLNEHEDGSSDYFAGLLIDTEDYIRDTTALLRQLSASFRMLQESSRLLQSALKEMGEVEEIAKKMLK